MRGQSLDERSGQRMLAHVVQGRVVDHIVGVAGAQQVEEVQPALAARRAEPGEVVVADLRADAVGAAVARTGVVHGDPVRRLQPGAQHLAGLRQEVVLPVDQQAHDLALGDADADRLQQRHQTLDRHLTLVILHQHEAAQLRPEMAADAARQRRHDRLAVRRQPALAAVAHHPRGEHQVLHLVRLVALHGAMNVKRFMPCDLLLRIAQDDRRGARLQARTSRHNLVFGGPSEGSDHDAAMRIGGEAPGRRAHSRNGSKPWFTSGHRHLGSSSAARHGEADGRRNCLRLLLLFDLAVTPPGAGRRPPAPRRS